MPAVELEHHRTCRRMDFPIAKDHPKRLFAVAELRPGLQHRRSRQYYPMMLVAMPRKDL